MGKVMFLTTAKIQKAYLFLRREGLRKFVKRCIAKALPAAKHHQILSFSPSILTESRNNNQSNWYYSRFPNLCPLKTFQVPESSDLRINLVTDSINFSSLYGGVATAIVFSALLAESKSCKLRIITRTERANSQNVHHILSCNQIAFTQEVEFIFADIYSSAYELSNSTKDIYITTSWWTTFSTLESIHPSQIIYLLQEDERMFYPYGDDHYLCSTVLNNDKLKFLINTELLYKALVKSGLEHLKDSGSYFEPSFVPHNPNQQSRNPEEKKKFFFYARPNNLRNLFYLGTQVIQQAILEGILDPEFWEIYFVGKDLQEIVSSVFTSSKLKVNLVEGLSFQEYISFIGTIDLGLSLMYTPHPSYPPLDLAASGAVVVTNKFANKTCLSQYSQNIITKDLSMESLLDGLREGKDKIMKPETVRQNFINNALLKDWSISFYDILSNW